MLSVPDGRPAVTGASCSPPTPFPPPHLRGLRAEWSRLSRRLADPDIELTGDVVAALLLTYGRLLAAGGRVEPMLAAILDRLRDQLADADACLDG